jgi:hypothetical protein
VHRLQALLDLLAFLPSQEVGRQQVVEAAPQVKANKYCLMAEVAMLPQAVVAPMAVGVLAGLALLLLAARWAWAAVAPLQAFLQLTCALSLCALPLLPIPPPSFFWLLPL